MEVPTANRYPLRVLISQVAAQAMRDIAIAAYQRSRTEWGGLLWGHVFAHPAGGLVPVVLYASDGICRATAVQCEILSASWVAGRDWLRSTGQEDLLNIGDWHSHPRMGVFLSQTDSTSFWSQGHIPEWLSIIIDPFRGEQDVFGQGPDRTCRSVPTFIAGEKLLRSLQRLAAAEGGAP